MRLFVAIAPPPEALDELETLTAPLRAARDDLRWTSREAWHVTLAFLGEVHESALPGLLPRLERAAGRHHDFRLAIAGAGAACPATAGRWPTWPPRSPPGPAGRAPLRPLRAGASNRT